MKKKRKKKKNITNIPNKISNEFLNKILLKNKIKKDKNINEIDAYKLNKKYSEEIEDLIQRYIHEKQDFFLYLKTSIKNMLETLIKFHNLEIENHNENLRFESANKWIMDKKSLMIAFELIKKVIVSKNDLDE
tara:strand:+ start:269 stop:667 length:399 start_codon:yes stop_codon:yes gene_type:complete